MGLQFYIFLLSVPFFYIFGFISFFKWLKERQRSDKQKRTLFLSTLIRELENQEPSIPADALLSKYKDELNSLRNTSSMPAQTSQTQQTPTPVPVQEPIRIQQAPQIQVAQQKSVFENWYSENSISLILYIGAFLIVASVSIFIGFQWDAMSGLAKALALTFVVGAFGAFGALFYSIPKIKPAGQTFLAIFALLIPFCGIGWDQFVFLSYEKTWLITSLVSLAVYTLFAKTMKKEFYTYIGALATLSVALSIVSNFNGDSFSYIMVGLFTTIGLLVAGITISTQSPYIKNPLETVTQILAPLFIATGTLNILATNSFATTNASILFFTGALFYMLSYLYMRETALLLVTLALYPLGIISLFNAYDIHTYSYIYVLIATGIFDLFVYRHLQKNDPVTSTNTLLFVPIAKLILAGFLSVDIPSAQLVIVMVLIALGFALTARIQNERRFFYGTTITLYIALYNLLRNIAGISLENSSLVFLLIGVALVVFGLKYISEQKVFEVPVISGVIALTVAQVYAMGNNYILLINTAFVAGLLYLSYAKTKLSKLAYLGNFYVAVSLALMYRILEIDLMYAPLYFVFLTLLFLTLFFAFKDQLAKTFLYSLLVVGLFGSLLGLRSLGTGTTTEELQLLLTFTLLLSTLMVWQKQKDSYFAYLGSAIAIIMYFQTLVLLQVSEFLAYSIPLGLYFIALSVIRKVSVQEQKTLESIGLFALTVPVISYGVFDTNIIYSVILLALSLSLIFVGITAKSKSYTYVGIASLALWVISKTYIYIINLPKWSLTGIVGIAFLTLAIYLLYSRKEE